MGHIRSESLNEVELRDFKSGVLKKDIQAVRYGDYVYFKDKTDQIYVARNVRTEKFSFPGSLSYGWISDLCRAAILFGIVEKEAVEAAQIEWKKKRQLKRLDEIKCEYRHLLKEENEIKADLVGMTKGKKKP